MSIISRCTSMRLLACLGLMLMLDTKCRAGEKASCSKCPQMAKFIMGKWKIIKAGTPNIGKHSSAFVFGSIGQELTISRDGVKFPYFKDWSFQECNELVIALKPATKDNEMFVDFSIQSNPPLFKKLPSGFVMVTSGCRGPFWFYFVSRRTKKMVFDYDAVEFLAKKE